MVNHPNRSKKTPSPGRNPSPGEIVKARNKAGLTQAQAAALIYTPRVVWDSWELGLKRMPPMAWELFLIKSEIVLD